MAEEKLLTVREVSLILGISEKEVIELAESGKIPAYKIAGVYLRFKLSQIKEVAESFKKVSRNSSLYQKDSFKDKVIDFFYFNDFYIVSFIIILLILYIIFKG